MAFQVKYHTSQKLKIVTQYPNILHFPCIKQFEYKSTENDLESLCGSYYYILTSSTCFGSS